MSKEDEDKHKTSTGKWLLISKKLKKEIAAKKTDIYIFHRAKRRNDLNELTVQLEWARSWAEYIWNYKSYAYEYNTRNDK